LADPLSGVVSSSNRRGRRNVPVPLAIYPAGDGFAPIAAAHTTISDLAIQAAVGNYGEMVFWRHLGSTRPSNQA
jgi:hypothetical protein